MIKSVIQADVTYFVEFEQKLADHKKKKIIEGLALDLGADLKTMTINSFKGKSLFWGIRDDIDLAGISLDSLPPTGSKKRKRLFSSDDILTIQIDE